MQEELKGLQKSLGITFVFVTHDQGEALSMADRIAVFNDGRIQQLGTPEEVYNKPRTRFVADFVGSSNVLTPDVAARLGGPRRDASLRPEAIRLGAATSGETAVTGRLLSSAFLGATHRLTVDVEGARIAVSAPAGSAVPAIGETVTSPFRPPTCIRWRPHDQRQPSCRRCRARPRPHRPPLRHALAPSAAFRRHAAATAAALARHHLCRLALCAARQSFFSIDDFSGLVTYELTLSTYGQLLSDANFDIIVRTVSMAALVTLASAAVAFPIAYYAARYAKGRMKAFFYLAVMLPLWSSYLVKVYAWKLILAKEGILTWFIDRLHLTWLLDAWLALPVIGGSSLSVSYTGTFLVFLYVWMPFMILPIQAALERVPGNLIEASADLGATPGQTFRTVIFPLALPGIVAGSIFTFSLTLGDYIIPQIVGSSRLFIGQAVYAQQGTAGNIPLAAAFSVVPIVIMGLYLAAAKRMGAFNAL